MALSFLEEQFDDLHAQPGALWNLDPLERRCPRSWLPDPQCSRLANRNELGDGGVAGARHLPHPAFANRRRDLVDAETGAGSDGHSG